MPSIRDDLQNFYEFAQQRLASGASAASLDELFMEWHDCHARDAVNAAIRHGLADVEAGRYTPADEAMRSLAQIRTDNAIFDSSSLRQVRRG